MDVDVVTEQTPQQGEETFVEEETLDGEEEGEAAEGEEGEEDQGGLGDAEPGAEAAGGTRAEEGDEPPLKKIKKPTSAFFFFCGGKREEIKAATPEMSMTDMQKALGVAWKALEDTAREPFTKQAADDKEVRAIAT
jgi:hypothetical protein